MTEKFSFPSAWWIRFHLKLKISQELVNQTAQAVGNQHGRQADACISEVVRNFQATANVRFQVKEWQVTTVKGLLLNHDVLAVPPTGYGKSLIFQSFVVVKELLNSAKACVLVICLLTH